MALEVIIVSGSGQEHGGCLLLTSEVLFVVSVSEDTQQQAFPITEVTASSKGDRERRFSIAPGTVFSQRWFQGLGQSVNAGVLLAGGVSAGTGRAEPAHPDAAAADCEHRGRGETADGHTHTCHSSVVYDIKV